MRCTWLLCPYMLFTTFIVAATEYYIPNDRQLSYLHHKFDQIEEEIFPADIRIKFSVSQLVGTLLYSMDRNMNQLIFILHDSTPPTLIIEFNTQRTFISISKLCSCEWCRYETLDLRLRIANREVHLRCNGGDTQSLVLQKTEKLNKDCPIMYNATNDSTTSINEGHIWLVNTPPIGGSTSNHYQTHGCIFEVAYRRRPISFKDVTPNIKRSCTPKCISNICNGGQCHETYNDYPVCNCTTTFLNGRYCNDSIASMNLKTLSSLYAFNMIKVSWKSIMNEIMRLHNTNLKIELNSNGDKLFVNYLHKNGMSFTSKTTIFENYVPNKESICIFYFHNNFIDIRTFNNGTWSKVTILSYTDIRQDVFDMITLQSGEGVIDLRYKYVHEYNWKKIPITKYENILYDKQPMATTTLSTGKETSKPNVIPVAITENLTTKLIAVSVTENLTTTFIAVSVSLGVITFLAIIAVIVMATIIMKKRCRKREARINNRNSQISTQKGIEDDECQSTLESRVTNGSIVHDGSPDSIT